MRNRGLWVAGLLGVLAILAIFLITVFYQRFSFPKVVHGPDGPVTITPTPAPVPAPVPAATPAPSRGEGVRPGAALEPPNEHETPAFAGAVVDRDTKAPLAGVKVVAYRMPRGDYSLADARGAFAEPTIIGEAYSGPNGQFRFEHLEFDEDETLAWRATPDEREAMIALFADAEQTRNRITSTFQVGPADSVQGVVVDQDGKPVAGVLVGDLVLEDTVGGRITGVGFHPSAWALTDEEGRFSVERLPVPDRDPKRKRDARLFRLPVRAVGYTPALSDEVKAGDRDVRIVLQAREAGLTGTVVDHQARPIPTTLVTLEPRRNNPNGLPPRIEKTLTDAGGRFAFPDLLAGSYALHARKELPEALGFPPRRSVEVALLRGQEKDVRVEMPAPTRVEGRFVDRADGKGVPGVRIFSLIDEVEAREAAPKVVTDEDGGFALEFYVEVHEGGRGFSPRLPVELPEPYLVPAEAARRGGEYTLEQQSLTLNNLTAGQAMTDLRIPLLAGEMVDGLVLQPDGSPAAETPVHYQTATLYNATLSDAEGRFRFPAPVESDLRLEGASEEGIGALVLAPGGDWRRTSPVVLQLQEYATIKGTVRKGAEGDPYEGLDIVAERTGLPDDPKHTIPENPSGVSDAEGNYQILRVAPGTVRARAMLSSSLALMEPEPIVVTLEPGEEREGVDFLLSEGDFIAGRVVDQDGQPIEGVTLFTNDSRISGQSDDEGSFRLEGVPYDRPLEFVTASLEGYEEQTKRNVSIYDGELTFTLGRTGTASVRVVDGRGGRVLNYRLRTLREVRHIMGRNWDTVEDTVVTSRDGSHELAGLAAGTYRLEVERLDAQGQPTLEQGSLEFAYDTTKESGERELVVTLSDGVFLSGTVVQAGAEIPVPGATVELYDVPAGVELPRVRFTGPPYARVAILTADAQGAFAVGPLPPGRYRVAARKDTLACEPVAVDASGSGPMPPVRLELAPAPVILGRVLDANGQPAAHATVFFARGEGPPVGEALEVDGGVFEHRLPAAGTWRVIASMDTSPETAVVRVELGPGEEREVVINFAERVHLTGRVTVNGKAVAQSYLLLVHESGDEAFAVPYPAAGAGGYEASLFPGQHQPFWATGVLRAPVGAALTIEEEPKEQTRNFDLKLADLDVLVDVPEGGALAGGELSLMLRASGGVADRPVLSGYALDRAQMRFFQVPEGTYRARLTRGGREIGSSDWLTVKAGEGNALVIGLTE